MRDILNITITAVIAPIVVSVSVHALNEAYDDWLESHRCKKRKHKRKKAAQAPIVSYEKAFVVLLII